MIWTGEAPLSWYVAFYPHARTWWVKAIPGRFKHVAAFGYFPVTGIFVLFDPALDAWHMTLIPPSSDVLGPLIDGATVVRIPAEPRVYRRRRLGMWCVPAIRQLVEIPGGALRPDGLLRDCLRIPGAEVIGEQPVRPQGLHAGRGA